MAWTVPQYTPQQVNAAGRALGQTAFPVTTDEGQEALTVINNWRSSHAYPLNTFQITLRNRARRIERNVIIAQREKRLDSIHRKLVAKATMRMTQMQDIAGCRAVFSKLSDVYKLVDLYKSRQFDHKFRNEKDYIADPKPDGYRRIRADDGTIYDLPDGEYTYSGAQSVAAVRDSVLAIASVFTKDPAVLVTQAAGRAWMLKPVPGRS